MTATMEELIVSIVDRRFEERREELVKEVMLDVGAKRQRTLFNQKETASLCNVSVSTFRKWKKMGLKSEASPTGKLLFDIDKVNQWREENDKRKIR